jgi:hypothetical protein
MKAPIRLWCTYVVTSWNDMNIWNEMYKKILWEQQKLTEYMYTVNNNRNFKLKALVSQFPPTTIITIYICHHSSGRWIPLKGSVVFWLLNAFFIILWDLPQAGQHYAYNHREKCLHEQWNLSFSLTQTNPCDVSKIRSFIFILWLITLGDRDLNKSARHWLQYFSLVSASCLTKCHSFHWKW